ncbi:octicosapeptide/Phox/Bem1p family protein [Actinidia rufa]|uniref:Octicosapeptide/Phox/Bem1p family protein n=1 Tax=Actinidia rufa TaxID=165716 RepID=A0A7J0GH02_9ERIC|nr:octicosapeptide/Phox/Bem1p family protein [Actinidia rufa]
MENYSLSSYPDSGASTPLSREIDCENSSSRDEPISYKVKLFCSYGGRILPRPHDNLLSYVGGDTKILAVDRSVRFRAFVAKLSALCDSEVCFRYQLPGENLDALISVTNDEDLEHMMVEYDRLCRASTKPARLRLFLFPVNQTAMEAYGADEAKSEREWFVDELNSARVRPIDVPSSPSAAVTADESSPGFLFGLDKSHAPPAKGQILPEATVSDVFPREIHDGSDCGSEDRHVIGDPVVSAAEMQRQIQEFQRLQIAGNEQVRYYRKSDEANPRDYSGEYYAQVQEKHHPSQSAVPVPIPIPAAYWQERGYAAPARHEPPVYLIQTPAGVYQSSAMQPITGQFPGQAYYRMHHRLTPEIYQEHPVYNTIPPPSIQQPQVGAYVDAVRMLRPPAAAGVGYDGAGRQVYYTLPGGLVSPYQDVTAPGDVRQGGGGAWIPESSTVVAKRSEAS